MCDIALPQRRRLGIERVEIGQAHDLARIELVGIAQQPIERGGGNIDIALFRRRIGRGPRIAFGRRCARHGAGQRDRVAFFVTRQHLAQQCLHTQQETRGDRRPGLVALRPREHDLGRPHRAGQIVRREADAEIGAGNAQRAQHRRREQRVDPAPGGPDAFVEARTDDQFGAVHPAFEQAQNMYPRMPAIGRPHCDLLHRITQRDARLGRRERKTRLARMQAQILDKGGERAAIFPGPQLLAAQRLARLGQRIQHFGQRRAFLLPQGKQRHQRLFDHRVPCADPRMGFGQLGCDLRKRDKTARLPRPAQAPLDPAQLAQPRTALHPAIDQRMRQQPHQRHGRGVLRHHLGQQQEQPPRGGLRQRAARRIVGSDIPAVEMMHHPPRQCAVRGYDRHAPFGLVERFAHQQRDRLRLFFWRGTGHCPQARQAALFGRQIDPALARLGREKQRADRMATLGRRRGEALAMPRLHFFPRNAHAVEQQLEVILRMRHCIVARKRRRSRLGRRARPPQFVPDRLRHRQVEIGQDDRALFEIRHDAQQPRERRRRAGHPRSHDRRRRRILLPTRGGPVEQPIAPRGRIERVPFAQLCQPLCLHAGEQVETLLPMARQRSEQVEHGLAKQLFGPHALDQQPVHRRAHLARQPEQGRPTGRFVAHGFANKLGQREQPPLRIDRGRDVGRAKRIEQGPKRLVEIEIADHRHARHQQTRRRVLACVTDESLGNRPPRTAARDQQRQPRKAELGVRISRDEAGNQRIGKAAMGSNRVDLRLVPFSHP